MLGPLALEQTQLWKWWCKRVRWVVMWPCHPLVPLSTSPSGHKGTPLSPGWLVPALAWLFEIACALTHPGKGEGASSWPRGWERQGDSDTHREVENGPEQEAQLGGVLTSAIYYSRSASKG